MSSIVVNRAADTIMLSTTELLTSVKSQTLAEVVTWINAQSGWSATAATSHDILEAAGTDAATVPLDADYVSAGILTSQTVSTDTETALFGSEILTSESGDTAGLTAMGLATAKRHDGTMRSFLGPAKPIVKFLPEASSAIATKPVTSWATGAFTESSMPKAFQIQNIGAEPLTGVTVTLAGTSASDATLTTVNWTSGTADRLDRENVLINAMNGTLEMDVESHGEGALDLAFSIDANELSSPVTIPVVGAVVAAANPIAAVGIRSRSRLAQRRGR